MEVVLRMLFYTCSEVDIWFVEKKLTWRSYKTIEAFPTTKNKRLSSLIKKNLQQQP